MKITNKLFEPYRFPTFWCLLISIHFCIMAVSIIDKVYFLSFGLIALLAFSTWVEDLEAGKHNQIKKHIISLLIILSCVLIFIGFIFSNDSRTRIFIYLVLMLVMQFIFLIAIRLERRRHN